MKITINSNIFGTVEHITKLISEMEIEILTDYKGRYVARSKKVQSAPTTSGESLEWIYTGSLHHNSGKGEFPKLPFHTTTLGSKVWESFSQQVMEKLLTFVKEETV